MRTKIFSEYRSLFFLYFRPHWGKLLILLLLLFGNIGLQLLGPLILRTFIDDALAKSSISILIDIALLFIIVTLVSQVAGVAEAYVAGDIAWTATNELRADVTTHCLRLDMDFHNTHTPGEMIERIDGDVGMLNEFFSRFVIALVANALFLIGIIVVVWHINWFIGLALGMYTIVTLIIMVSLRRFGIAPWKVARQASADLFSFLEERITSTDDIRTMGATAYMLSRLYPLLRVRLHTTRKGTTVGMLIWSVTTFLFAGGSVLSLSLGAYFFRAGALSLGTVFLLFNYSQQLLQPLGQISGHLNDFQQAAASIARLQDILRLQPGVMDGSRRLVTKEESRKPLSVGFCQVTFEYNQGENILKDVSFSVEAGKTLGILGRTGSGKTTIARLLFRLYDPLSGAIYVDGVDIKTIRLNDLRSHVGLVTQDVQLFYATVRENVTMFDSTIIDEEIFEAFHDLGLWEWYQALSNGLDTLLEASGKGLSAGEAQLLALTRVFLKKPLVVILDEATSRIDPATEAFIERAVDKLLCNCTSIIIAHRLSTIRRADSILFLEDGRVCEQGSSVELLQNPESRFYHLLQMGQGEIQV